MSKEEIHSVNNPLFILENHASPSPQNIARIVDKQVVITFPDGIPAFEDAKEFALSNEEKIRPFLYLNSLDIKGLGFVCVDPFLIYPGYTLNLTSKDIVHLDLKEPGDALVLSFVTVNENVQSTTANLMAPVVTNVKNLRGRQIILENYPIQYSIWDIITKSQQNKEEAAPC